MPSQTFLQWRRPFQSSRTSLANQTIADVNEKAMISWAEFWPEGAYDYC